MISIRSLFEGLYPAEYYVKKANSATSPEEKDRYNMLARRAREAQMGKTTKRINKLKNKLTKPVKPMKRLEMKRSETQQSSLPMDHKPERDWPVNRPNYDYS